MNEFIQGAGVLTPAIARSLGEHLGDSATPNQRASIERTIEPERQYQDLSVYESPGCSPAWVSNA